MAVHHALLTSAHTSAKQNASARMMGAQTTSAKEQKARVANHHAGLRKNPIKRFDHDALAASINGPAPSPAPPLIPQAVRANLFGYDALELMARYSWPLVFHGP